MRYQITGLNIMNSPTDTTNIINKYIDHLCGTLHNLNNYESDNSFLNIQNKETSKSFLLDNLFLFYLYIQGKTNKYTTEIKELYECTTSNLYHYTTYESLEKIISNKSLKLNNILEMNDTEEGKAIEKHLSNKHESRKKEYKLPLIRKINEQKIAGIKQDLPKYNSGIFSFSFSVLNDDASQWDRYGIPKGNRTNPPSGVCLEISSTQLKGIINKIKANTQHIQYIDIVPVLYTNYGSDNVFLTNINDKIFLQSNLEIMLSILNGQQHDDKLTQRIAMNSAYIKHCSFRYERELRLIAIIDNAITECTSFGSLLLNIAYGDDNCKLSDLITSITIGPGASAYRPKIEKLLKENNINVDFKKYIKESDCPLRYSVG